MAASGPPFDIPGPKSELSSNETQSAKEAAAFSSGSEHDMPRVNWDWRIRVCFRVFLFVFVLGINVYWSHQIVRLLWQSGSAGNNFHLSDSVLIALVSTSIANFLGLVVIVARHLFPSDPSK